MGIGLCNKVQVGDVVCVLPGAGAPFILREVDVFGAFPNLEVAEQVHAHEKNVFELISIAYVAGIMDGELFYEDGLTRGAQNIRLEDVFIV